VHCHQGVSRSCSYCIAYLMARKGLTYEQVRGCLGGFVGGFVGGSLVGS